MTFLLAVALQLQAAHAAPSVTKAQNVRFTLPGSVRPGDPATRTRGSNRIVIPASGNLKYKRSALEGIGLALSRGTAKLRLTSHYVIVSFQVKAIGNGTFAAWTDSTNNTRIQYTLQAGQSYSFDTGWTSTTRLAKIGWNPKKTKNKEQGLILTSVTVARSVPSPTPTMTPTATPTTPQFSTPTPLPTTVPTTLPTSTPIPNDPGSCPGFVIEGFGNQTTGGCGGQVYTVTSLEDPATPTPGTFRYYLLNTTGKRIVKFAVSGTISLRNDITITNGDLTIDAGDAPGAGVQFKGATLIVSASNVILRHLRVLVGPYSLRPGQADGIRIAGDLGYWVERVVLDHCSMLWATDENLSIVDKVRNVTVQWSLIAEGLYLATHPKGAHSMGALMTHEATRMTMHHNLIAHNNYRNPQLASRGVLEWINNVAYDTGSAAGILETPLAGDENWLDAIGNYNKLGPSSDWAGSRYRYSWRQGVVAGLSHLYIRGNLDWNRTSYAQDEKLVASPYIYPWISSTRFVPDSQVTISSADQAYEDVLHGAGATLPCRSPVDQRIVTETRSGTGGFVNYPEERGGWPDLTLGCQ